MTAWGIGAGDTVLIPAMVTLAAVEAIRRLDAIPVFVDIDPDTYNINPCAVEKTVLSILGVGKLTPKVIISVDMFGLPADYEALELLASKYGIKTIEDATQALGATYNGRKAGSFGDVAFGTFSPPKLSGRYGEDGAAFLNDYRLAEVIKAIGSSEQDRQAVVKAAGILPRLAILEGELKQRSRVAERYTMELNGIVKTPTVSKWAVPAWSSYCVMARDEVERERIRRRFREFGIPVGMPFERPLWLEEDAGVVQGEFPGAELVRRRALLLQMHAYLTDEGMDEIVRAIK